MRGKIQECSIIYTDELHSYNNLNLRGYKHANVLYGAGECTRGECHVNLLEPLVAVQTTCSRHAHARIQETHAELFTRVRLPAQCEIQQFRCCLDKTHTNTFEGYLNIFKHGMKGDTQHCSKMRLLAIPWNLNFSIISMLQMASNDVARAKSLLKGIVGTLVTYQNFSLAMVQYTRYIR